LDRTREDGQGNISILFPSAKEIIKKKKEENLFSLLLLLAHFLSITFFFSPI